MQKIIAKIKYNVLPVMLSVLFVLTGFAGFATTTVSAEDKIIIHMNTEGLENAPDITAGAAVLLNSETGNIVYEKNIDRTVFPGSTVKIMTAIVVLENVDDLESQTLISKYVVDHTVGRVLGVTENEAFTIEHLLNAMLIMGANDAALALAEYVGGDIQSFVDKMNEKAAELGCENTVFTNPTGMHSENMYTTVRDIAKIAFYASKIQKIMDITSSTTYIVPPTNKERDERKLSNHNLILSRQHMQYYYEYAKGINYGYTAESGYCLTTVAEQAGLSYLCVLTGATATVISEDIERINCFGDAESLFDWAFSIYTYHSVISATDKLCSVKIRLSSNTDDIMLYPDRDIAVLIPQNADVDKEITIDRRIFDDKLVAPIEKGQILGTVTVYYNGEEKGSANLLSSADVELSWILYFLDRIMQIVSSVWFKASVVAFIVIFAAYTAVNLLRKNKKEQRRFY